MPNLIKNIKNTMVKKGISEEIITQSTGKNFGTYQPNGYIAF